VSEHGRVVVVGSLNIDHVVEAPAFPGPGETIMGERTRTSPGGKGANQAVAAALAGAPVTMVGRVGEDTDSRLALESLHRAGVDTSAVARVPGAETGTAWITVAGGENTIIVIAGANHDWPGPDPELPDAVAEAAVVVAQLEVPLEVVSRAAERTRGLFLLNPSPAAELPDALLARCDVLIVNEHELSVLAGTPEGTPVERAHAAARARGARAVVTTLGAGGAVVTDADGTTSRVPALPAPEVVDSTGAGDAFAGVVAARLAAGDTLEVAARWGAAAGSYAVRSAGAQDSYPDAATLRALLP
jgi:ribokinase